jgi:endonuclease YncB( thermonuclease family)
MLSRLLFALAALLALAACREGMAKMQVLDGATILIGKKEHRLYGIEAPPLDQYCGKGPSAWRCGMAARDELARLVGTGPVECRQPERDDHNKRLSHCFVNGVDLGEAMARSGLVRLDRHHPEAYAKAAAEARAAQRGLWAQDATTAPPSVGGAGPSGAKPKG